MGDWSAGRTIRNSYFDGRVRSIKDSMQNIFSSLVETKPPGPSGIFSRIYSIHCFTVQLFVNRF